LIDEYSAVVLTNTMSVEGFGYIVMSIFETLKLGLKWIKGLVCIVMPFEKSLFWIMGDEIGLPLTNE
jgi:hypothetical protein